MKKMKKMVSLALTAAMTAGLMTGMGAMTASADSERTKITALLKGTESSEQYLTLLRVVGNTLPQFSQVHARLRLSAASCR